MNGELATVKVRVVAFECVVASGTRKTTWLVHLAGQWVSAKDVPGAELTRETAGAGTIWQTVAELPLQVGCWVQQVQSSPLRAAHTDPLRYLQQESRGMKRRTARTYFRVTADGRLQAPPKGEIPP
jgi:hypothetical protein